MIRSTLGSWSCAPATFSAPLIHLDFIIKLYHHTHIIILIWILRYKALCLRREDVRCWSWHLFALNSFSIFHFTFFLYFAICSVTSRSNYLDSFQTLKVHIRKAKTILCEVSSPACYLPIFIHWPIDIHRGTHCYRLLAKLLVALLSLDNWHLLWTFW